MKDWWQKPVEVIVAATGERIMLDPNNRPATPNRFHFPEKRRVK